MGLDQQGAKLSGIIGTLIGRLMNRVHYQVYRDYFKNHLPADGATILDLGCGGGQLIRYLSGLNDSYTLWGLDHSPEMIALSNKVNKRGIEKNRVSLTQGSVLELPYGDHSANLVTALETIQFWPDISKALSEIRRVLKPDGHLVIINRYPPERSVWWNKIQLKSDEAYQSVLAAAGFADIKTNTRFRKHWIFVEAR